MRWSKVAFVWVLCVCAPLAAEEPTPQQAGDRLVELLEADATPELLGTLLGGGPEATSLQAALASDPAQTLRVARALGARHEALATRDGDRVLELADWVVGLAMKTRKDHGASVDAVHAQVEALLARARLAGDLDQAAPVSCWIRAVDFLADAAGMDPQARPGEAWVRGLRILHDACDGEKASVRALLDHASVVCSRALKACGDREDVRRAVVESYDKQVVHLFDVSRKQAQDALIAYFDAFRPIAHDEAKRSRDDVRAWNKMITFAREEKIKVKEDYISRPGASAPPIVRFQLPETGGWKNVGGRIVQVFSNPDVVRTISFSTYSWSSVYSYGGAKDVGGDNLKGIAGLAFDEYVDTSKEEKRKIKRKQKPARGKINQALGSGILWTLEVEYEDETRYRIRSFYVRAVKAQQTVRILILESAELPADDPEFEAVVDSLEIHPDKR